MASIQNTKPAGGKTLYGVRVGILMMETRFPRVPGDIGNAHTWPFPVLCKVVRGAVHDSVIVNEAQGLLDACDEIVQRHPDVGAVILETTDMVPFSRARLREDAGTTGRLSVQGMLERPFARRARSRTPGLPITESVLTADVSTGRPDLHSVGAQPERAVCRASPCLAKFLPHHSS